MPVYVGNLYLRLEQGHGIDVANATCTSMYKEENMNNLENSWQEARSTIK